MLPSVGAEGGGVHTWEYYRFRVQGLGPGTSATAQEATSSVPLFTLSLSKNTVSSSNVPDLVLCARDIEVPPSPATR